MAADRAKQFMPFASLKGYYEMTRRREHIREPRRELSEDSAEELNRKLCAVQQGQMLTVTYYRADHYEDITGMVSEFNTAFRRLTIVKTVIPFDDIIEIVRVALPGDCG
ncbi:MAG: YolD-like family protein [Oscillospiraceae bacterium]